MIHIKHGSIFDEKCDLLILPCDSGGGVTPWVESEIALNNLPFPNGGIPFGSVLFTSTNTYSKAEHIGYAASVDAETVTSELKAISAILVDTINYCTETNCTIVNLPTLGTGAGKLDMSKVIKLYTENLSNTNIKFNVFIPSSNNARLYAERNNKLIANTSSKRENPREGLK